MIGLPKLRQEEGVIAGLQFGLLLLEKMHCSNEIKSVKQIKQ